MKLYFNASFCLRHLPLLRLLGYHIYISKMVADLSINFFSLHVHADFFHHFLIFTFPLVSHRFPYVGCQAHHLGNLFTHLPSHF